MSRNYHVDIAAFAADTDRKWVDNLLSHFDVPGVESQKQGVARRLSIEAVQTVVLVRALVDDTGLATDRALATATRLLDAENGRLVGDSGWLTVHIDRAAFDAEIDRRVAAAVEAVVPKRRGRPATARMANEKGARRRPSQ
jgi:hypothetical protein